MESAPFYCFKFLFAQLNSDMNGFVQRGIAHLTYYTDYRIKATVTFDRPYNNRYSYEISSVILSEQVEKQMLSYLPTDGNSFELYISKYDSTYSPDIDVPVAWIAIGR